MSTSTATGCEQFAALCQKLIDEDGHSYLCPEIGRSRATDWMAFIFEHHDEGRMVRLASGQADTLDAACAACVVDFYVQEKIKARKAELMKNPEVVEALELFKK